MLDVSFVDDVAIPVLSPAIGLVSKVSRVVACVVEVFSLHGMALNFKPGKSEGIIGFNGQGSRISRLALASASMQVLVPNSSVYFRFVAAYHHVGTYISARSDMCE